MTDAMITNVMRTYYGFILAGYAHNRAAYEAAQFWNVSYDWVREYFRPR